MLTPDSFTVKSHRGEYKVDFTTAGREEFLRQRQVRDILLVDKNVLATHGARLSITDSPNLIEFDALERNKDLSMVPELVERILQKGVTKRTRLVVVGGGITQDMGAFAASMIFRGIEWVFFPTTLLAQGDSCVGSKTSINVGFRKNQVGNFNPPSQVVIDPEFIETLPSRDIHSGCGEIIKVHLLNGQLERIEKEFHLSFTDKRVRMSLIESSLKIKKWYIEQDEFDVGVRNLLNYGHTFGHALESATNFEIPHGLAVTVGMDIANFISWKQGLISEGMFYRIRQLLQSNFPDQEFGRELVGKFVDALRTDKKNVGGKLTAILTRGPGKMEKVQLSFDQQLVKLIESYEEA